MTGKAGVMVVGPHSSVHLIWARFCGPVLCESGSYSLLVVEALIVGGSEHGRTPFIGPPAVRAVGGLVAEG